MRADGLNNTGTALLIPDAGGRAPADPGYISTTGVIKANIDRGVLRIVGLPGQEVAGSFVLETVSGYNAPASNMRWFGDGGVALPFFSSLNNDAIPFSVNNLSFSNSGADIIVNYTITLPEDSEYEDLHIAGEVDPFTPSTVAVPFTVTTNIAGATLSRADFRVLGSENDVIPISVIITPRGGDQFATRAGFTTSNRPSTVGAGDFRQLGTSIIWNTDVTIPATAPTTQQITIGGPASTNAPGSTLSTVSIDFHREP